MVAVDKTDEATFLPLIERWIEPGTDVRKNHFSFFIAEFTWRSKQREDILFQMF